MPEVVSAVSDLLNSEKAGLLGLSNPSSVHREGAAARKILARAKASLLKLLGCEDFEGAGTDFEANAPKVIFNSGGTEACNFLVNSFSPIRSALISSIEHPALKEALQESGAKLSFVEPRADGYINQLDFLAALNKETDYVSLIAAHNELGTVQPVIEIAKSLREGGFNGIITSDFIQVPGKLMVELPDYFKAGVDAVSISGHKFGSLGGVGAVILSPSKNRCLQLRPQIVGGPQQEKFRAGTENILGIYSLAVASESLSPNLESTINRRAALREMLWDGIKAIRSQVERLSPGGANSLCNTLFIRFPGLRADDLVVALDLEGVACSRGAACSSGKQEASLAAVYVSGDEQAGNEVIRFSLDVQTTEQEILETLKRLENVLKRFADV